MQRSSKHDANLAENNYLSTSHPALCHQQSSPVLSLILISSAISVSLSLPLCSIIYNFLCLSMARLTSLCLGPISDKTSPQCAKMAASDPRDQPGWGGTLDEGEGDVSPHEGNILKLGSWRWWHSSVKLLKIIKYILRRVNFTVCKSYFNKVV